MKDAASIVAKYVERAKAAKKDYDAGVRNPEQDWQKNTLAADARRKANLDLAEKEGRWKNAITKTPTAEWQKRTIAVGPDRFEQGVDSNQDKELDYFTKAVPLISASQAAIRAMPNATPEDNKKRMLANFDNMSKLRGLRKK